LGAYAELESRFRRMMTLQSVEDVLHWDTAAMMPAASGPARAEQLALLRVMRHEMLCRSDTEALLDAAAGDVGDGDAVAGDGWRGANLREMRRTWIHAAAVPADIVEALSKANSKCEVRWREAKESGDFNAVAPLLAEVLRLIREVAAARAERLGTSRYEAMLDEHEPGMRCQHIDVLFDDLAAWLPGLLERALERQAERPQALALQGPFAIEAQRKLGERLMQVVGFERDHGRLDVSAHPFCGGTPDDVRITTRYDENDFVKSLMGVLHETGHALYQRGLPQKWRHQPVGDPRGMGTHESQSLLIEMQACRSRAFLRFAAPIIREAFGKEGDAWSADNLYLVYTRVEPGFIRVDADEVTYPAHIILRYRLEKAMVDGELEVNDLPTAWNEGMQNLLGITPPDHSQGCLQDIHWYDGAFGYFPSYTLGAITAAQLFRTAIDGDDSITAGIEKGDLARWSGGYANTCTVSDRDIRPQTSSSRPPAASSTSPITRRTSTSATPDGGGRATTGRENLYDASRHTCAGGASGINEEPIIICAGGGAEHARRRRACRGNHGGWSWPELAGADVRVR
jgi:carboxypeptidase Taq